MIDGQQMPLPEPEGFLDLARMIAGLKSVPRTGWSDRGVARDDVESVADHSFGVTLLAWLAAAERLGAGAAIRPERVALLALVHDLAEAETGDEPPYDPAALAVDEDPTRRRAFLERRHVRDPERVNAKRAAEEAAMKNLLEALPPAAREALGAIWEDLRDGTSEEAKFVKQVDRLETFLQSRHYRDADPDLPVASFEQEVKETIDDPVLRSVRDAALRPDPGESD